MDARRPLIDSWIGVVADAAAVFTEGSCCGCGRPGRVVCPECTAAVPARAHRLSLGDELPTLWCAGRYDGLLRRLLLAVKDGGRVGAARALAPALAAAVVAAEREAGGRPLLTTVPSTRAAFRQRGYRPVELLLHRARLRPVRLLRWMRPVADQAGLDAVRRRSNRARSLGARRGIRGLRVIVVDDIVTTGATLGEAVRALEEAGACVVALAAVARTPRRDREVR